MLPAESPALQLSFEPLFKANAQNLAEKGTDSEDQDRIVVMRSKDLLDYY